MCVTVGWWCDSQASVAISRSDNRIFLTNGSCLFLIFLVIKQFNVLINLMNILVYVDAHPNHNGPVWMGVNVFSIKKSVMERQTVIINLMKVRYYAQTGRALRALQNATTTI